QDTKPSQPSSASEEASHSEGEEVASNTPTDAEDSNSDTTQPTDEAPWPPLGLSALLMPPPEGAATPVVAPPAAQGEARPDTNPALPNVTMAIPTTPAIAAAQASAADSAEPLHVALNAAIA